MPINVYSEIGKLKKVLLYRPNDELENLSPNYLTDLLFDDIPYLKKAQEEHDEFAKAFKENGAEVLYVDELLSETINNNNLKNEFLEEFFDLSEINNNFIREDLKKFLLDLNTQDMVTKLIAGIRTEEMKLSKNIFSVKVRTANMDTPFFLNPMPNFYFQRDPVAMIGKGAAVNRMKTPARRRESMFMEYVLKHHPDFKGTPLYYEKNFPYAIEGGDVLVLNEKTIAVGISLRTDPESLEILAEKIFKEYNDKFETILGILIPAKRAYMHLDTVFTMLDYDKFVVHSKLEEDMRIFAIRKNGDKDFHISEEKNSLKVILEEFLDVDKVTLLKCGGNDIIGGEREQWNDGSNCVAIEPGKIIVYDRNTITNKIIRETGVEAIEITSGELSRGRGGPRCMSMPLERE